MFCGLLKNNRRVFFGEKTVAEFKEYLEMVMCGENLSMQQSQDLQDQIFSGEIEPLQIAAFLCALRTKGETADELAGLVASLRSHVAVVNPKVKNLVDTCGTGGASAKTFNISTAAGIVAAGAGVNVAKHGNRSITSNSGSADCFEELGVNIDPGVEKVEQCIEQCGIGFMFAPKFHPAMKYVQPIRKSLGVRTVFNFLGPMANPAGVKRQVVGVADKSLQGKIVSTLHLLGAQRVMVVHSDGLDEISTMGSTLVSELRDGQILNWEINPSEFGIPLAKYEDLAGSSAQENANIIRAILNGDEQGAKRDIVVLNSAASILISDIATDFKQAIDLANKAIDDKKALGVLESFVEISNS